MFIAKLTRSAQLPADLPTVVGTNSQQVLRFMCINFSLIMACLKTTLLMLDERASDCNELQTLRQFAAVPMCHTATQFGPSEVAPGSP
jgi:hypothetical protein